MKKQLLVKLLVFLYLPATGLADATSAAPDNPSALNVSRNVSTVSEYNMNDLYASQFKNGQFHNTETAEKNSIWQFLWLRATRPWSQWPGWVDTTEGEKPPEQVSDGSLRVTLINHATVLIQVNGFNILTDPVYSQRCSPVSFAGPKRVRAPGISFENLPPIHVVLISHDHYDHLDLATLKRLRAKNNPLILTGLKVSKHLDDKNNVQELDWWQKTEISSTLHATFVPTQHFSGRGLFDNSATLWGGFIIEAGNTRVYFGGDSGYGSHYKETYRRFGAMDLALLPIGAYAPREFMQPVHMNPEEAVQAHKDLHSQKSLGLHFGIFQLSAEPMNEPAERLQKATIKAGLTAGQFLILPLGEGLYLKSSV